MTQSFPEEVLEHVLSFLVSQSDRNAVSLVSKSWYDTERWCRNHIFIGNCYAVNPRVLTRRFKEVKGVELKGKPHFADFNLVPEGWGGCVDPWIVEMGRVYSGLEEIRLKRMVVTDEGLEMVAKGFVKLKVLVLASCDGFSTDGLAAVAANCRNLRVLDLRECEVEELSGHWLSHFPDTFTSLESLNITCLTSEVSFSALERLISRSPNLKTLKLNRTVPLEKLPTLLQRAPQLVEFGTGAYSAEGLDAYSSLAEAFSGCKKLKSLSGFWDVIPAYLPAVYSVCSQLTSLNLSYATAQSPDLSKIISHCHNLQRLVVLDYIEDTGLETVATSCKHLKELVVFPSDPYVADANVPLTEQGLVSVSQGCTKLHSILYFCRQMSNSALVSISKNRPNLTCFRLCILEPRSPDYLTLEPLDTGFGSIVENCKHLTRLSMSGLLTDRVFEYIGKHAKKLDMLSIAFAGDSDLGLHYILSGCDSLRKLEIRDCPFGDKALLANASKLETMRSLWMSSCFVSFEACKLLGQKMPRLNVEVIDERENLNSIPENVPVEKVYIYRTVCGQRFDMPDFVRIMGKDKAGVYNLS
ncbi:protein TRANSPORT INHIBITOR RESPONSE 1-like [Bidens hawaiensis]|uniref:protein TRANSPORT INHIBITOR RESPONSE 1-like n=1 Tax=Bidens hawaiensis TaxID=980011 RepID=UPI00404959E3